MSQAEPSAMSVPDLLDRMMKAEFYLIENRLLTKPDDLKEKIREHLLYMIDLEKSGTLFLSGPLYDDSGAMTGNGMTIIRAGSFEEAEAIASRDPFVEAGYREPRIHRWVVNEGRVNVRLDLSDKSSSLA
ncbi:YciI family protein [Jiella avicenniae]|uniref:YciI family protein n=1 Tax=Jiella avicenniae TaxID=2907202 RepID=A0A9X1P455_9HYPH|nr:YciI family protein [Jiella avicenniae]MCE7029404.1 YciI family protein [Jiella avicenniae]